MSTTRTREFTGRALLPILLDRRLDLGDRALDLVVGQIALDAGAIGQRQRTFELRFELAELERIGRRRRLIGERFGTAAFQNNGGVLFQSLVQTVECHGKNDEGQLLPKMSLPGRLDVVGAQIARYWSFFLPLEEIVPKNVR